MYLKNRQETAEANFKAHKQRPDLSYFKTLDATLKKNTAFVKKLTTISQLPKDQKDTLLPTIKTLNFKRYISEAVKSLGEITFTIDDVDVVIDLICYLHQYYEEFTPQMLKELSRVPEDTNKLRIVIRILSELYTLKILLDPSPLYTIISNLVDKTDTNNLAQNASTILEMVKSNIEIYSEQKFKVKIDDIYDKVVKELKQTDIDPKKQSKLFNVSKPLSELLNKEIVEIKKQEAPKVTLVLPEKFENEDIRLFYEDFVKLEEIKYEKPQEKVKVDQTKDKPKSEEKSPEDLCYEKLNYSVTSKHLIVEWAQNFLNVKGNKKQLAQYLFGVNRTSLQLLPLYSKLVAILNQKEITKEIVKELLDEFDSLHKIKNQNIESKIKNIRFIGEMCKFRLISPSIVLNIMSKLLDSPDLFVNQQIEVTYHLFEVCGRYLYATPETHESVAKLLEKMWRYKEVKNYDLKYILLIENAYHLTKAQKTPDEKLPPLWLYLESIIFSLARENIKFVLDKLIQFPDYSMIHRIFRDSRCKYSHLPFIAQLVHSLTLRDEAFGIQFVDQLLQDIRNSMNSIAFEHHQKRLLDVRLLSELYNYQMIDPEVIFETLYTFIFYSSENDLPQDTFRIRLICTLLDATVMHSDSQSHLEVFIYYLQNYILKKGMRLPIDVEFMLADTLERLKPNLKWPASYRESCDLIEKLSEPEILPGNDFLWEIGKKKTIRQHQEIVEEEKPHVKHEKKKEAFDKDQLDRELQQMMEESLNQRRIEVPRKLAVQRNFIILKK